MTDQELLKCYTDFVPFLAAVCGPGCEIVIHDVTTRNSLLSPLETEFLAVSWVTP